MTMDSSTQSESSDSKHVYDLRRSHSPPPADFVTDLEVEADFGDADYEAFLQATVALREKEHDPDFAPDVEEVEVEEEQEEELWEDGQDHTVHIIDDDFADDFAEVLAKSAGETFLPQFLDRTAKLDKDYTTVQSFVEDNATRIDDAETIIRACCHFLKKLTHDIPYKEYTALRSDDQGIHRQWYQWFCNRDAEALANTIFKSLPVQFAAALGREEFSVADLDRLPHIPPTTVYGCYFDHTTKTFVDTGEDGPSVEQYAYAGSGTCERGMRDGRVRRHLLNLQRNYNDLRPRDRSYHYEKAGADAPPKSWDEDKDGPWIPRWNCDWDFRAFSLTYPVDTISDMHQLVEGIMHACFNMLVYHHPTRARSRGNSLGVEKFIKYMRQYVEEALGRALPDLHHLSTNRSFALAEPRRVKESSKKATKKCIINGCPRSPDLLSDRSDPYSGRVCVLHYGLTPAFLTRDPCIDCGLERKDSRVTSRPSWSATRCSSCRQNHLLTRADWLARDPCSNCGVERKDVGGGGFTEYQGICFACHSYFQKNGTLRTKEMEEARQTLVGVQKMKSGGQEAHCSNCGIVCDGGKNSPTERRISKDGTIRCTICYNYVYKRGPDERPMGKWSGMKEFLAHYKDEFMLWVDNIPRDRDTCRCGRFKGRKNWPKGSHKFNPDTNCRSCQNYGESLVHLWPSFEQWVSEKATAQNKSTGELFEEIRQLEIQHGPATSAPATSATATIPGRKRNDTTDTAATVKSKPGAKLKNSQQTHNEVEPRCPRAAKRKIHYYEDILNLEDNSDKENIDPQGPSSLSENSQANFCNQVNPSTRPPRAAKRTINYYEDVFGFDIKQGEC